MIHKRIAAARPGGIGTAPGYLTKKQRAIWKELSASVPGCLMPWRDMRKDFERLVTLFGKMRADQLWEDEGGLDELIKLVDKFAMGPRARDEVPGRVM